MFEAVELGRKVASADYKAQVPALRGELLEVQTRLREVRRSSVIILFGGVDGAGKSESVNLLNEWMDPRWLLTRAYGTPSDEERERPEYWRFWRDLPPKGRIGFFLSAWYSRPFVDRVHRRLSRAEFGARLDEIIDFERGLTNDGALILKFWMHLDKSSQKARLSKLEKDPLTRWRVTREHWDNWKRYGRFIDAAEEIITRTSLANAPWTIVDGADERYRSLTIATADSRRDPQATRGVGGAAAGVEHEGAENANAGSVRKGASDPRAPADDPEPARHVAARGPEAVPDEARGVAGAAEQASRESAAARHFDDSRVRRLGRRRERRRHPAAHRGDRCAQLPGHSDRGPDRGGARAALPVAFLAPSGASRPRDDLRPELVWTRAR